MHDIRSRIDELRT